MIFIHSYQRPNLLLSLLQEINGKDDIVVFDDGSDYDPTEHLQYCDYYRFEHKGKEGFWVLWKYALEIAEESDDDWFLFLQDDIGNVQYDTIKKCCNAIEGNYAFNIMNVGEDRGWTKIKEKPVTVNGLYCYEMGYVDCKFATNRASLDKIGWTIKPIPIKRFNRPNISSGVGQQLSREFAFRNVTMYKPEKSLAEHRCPDSSKMHPELRKQQPLISR